MIRTNNNISKENKPINIVIQACILIVLIFKLHILLYGAVNQDEFINLSLLWEHRKGTLGDQFQTFIVNFFTWIPSISQNEIVQIITARLTLYALYISSCLIIYLISRDFLNKQASLFSLLCYISFSYVLANASSFRADSISGFLCLLSIYLLMRNRTGWRVKNTVISAIAMAVALIVTVKSVFYLPITLVIIFANERLFGDIAKKLKCLCLYTFTLVLGYSLLFLYYSSTLLKSNLPEPAQWIESTSSKAITLNDFFVRILFFKHSLYQNPVFWLLLIFGILFIIYDIRNNEEMHSNNNILLLSFSIPLLSLIFYYNSYPYFYAFILPTSAILCGVIIHKITEINRISSLLIYRLPIYALCSLILLSSFFYYEVIITTPNTSQKQFANAIHQIFPEPVSYIDGFSMVPSFTKAGFLMTTWGMENYLKSGKPIMKNLIANRKPVLLLANVPQLDLSLPQDQAVSPLGYGLLKEDWEVLQSNYIHHWGIIYVAGKHFEFSKNQMSLNFEILIPGFYTVESNEPVTINGFDYPSGCSVYLKKGNHRITTQAIPNKTKIRWGNVLYKPDHSLPAPLFAGALY